RRTSLLRSRLPSRRLFRWRALRRVMCSILSMCRATPTSAICGSTTMLTARRLRARSRLALPWEISRTMSKVIASEKGYWGGMIREIGDVFDMPEDEIKKTPWVRRHDEAAEPDAEV